MRLDNSHLTDAHPWWVRALPVAVVVAVLVITTPETYRLGRDLLGLPVVPTPFPGVKIVLATALPFVVDGYAVAALRFHRDRLFALGLLAVLVSLSVIVHTVGLDRITTWGRATMAVTVVLTVIAVAWRVHDLINARSAALARAARRAERKGERLDATAGLRVDRVVVTPKPAVAAPARDAAPVAEGPWANTPAEQQRAVAWLRTLPVEGRTLAALAGHTGWPRTGSLVRRLVTESRTQESGHGDVNDAEGHGVTGRTVSLDDGESQ